MTSAAKPAGRSDQVAQWGKPRVPNRGNSAVSAGAATMRRSANTGSAAISWASGGASKTVPSRSAAKAQRGRLPALTQPQPSGMRAFHTNLLKLAGHCHHCASTYRVSAPQRSGMQSHRSGSPAPRAADCPRSGAAPPHARSSIHRCPYCQ